MDNKFRLLLFIAILPFGMAAMGQSYLKAPKIWESVRYDRSANTYSDGEGSYRSEYWTFISKKQALTVDPWRVFTDRADVPVLDEPKGKELSKLRFSQIVWVYEEKDDHLKVGNETQVLGWVKKQDLILWKTPLRDKDTNIEIKAFAVNTTRASKVLAGGGVKKDYFDVYDSPQGGKKINERALYEVLFVYKYAPGMGGSSGRFLVSEFPALSSGTELTGWVSDERLKLWATQLCLEPNWDPLAIKERREKKVYAHIFESGNQVNKENQNAYFNGSGSTKGVLFNDPRDPAFEEGGIEASDRLPGFLFRYPVFSGNMIGESKDNCAFLTGAPTRLDAKYATITEGAASQDLYRVIQEEVEAMRRTLRNLNVVFVLEAGPGPRVALLQSAMKALVKADAGDNRLSMGAVVYYNDDAAKPDAKESTYIVKKELTTKGAGLGEWLSGLDMASRGDLVASRPSYRALIRAMEMAHTGETNIVIHLCGAPNHTDEHEGRAGYEAEKDLKAPLQKNKNVHYLGYVLPPTDAEKTELAETLYDQFKESTLKAMASAMREKYRSLVPLHSVDGKMPEAAKVDESIANEQRTLHVTPASMELKVRMYWPGSDVVGLITKDVGDCLVASEKFFKVMEKILVDGSDAAKQADPLSTEASASLIAQLCEGVSGGSEVDKMGCINYSFANKVHYFMDATTLYRAKNLQYPIFKYVIFMKDTELSDRIKQLSGLVNTLDGLTADSRKAIEEYWKNTAKSILGNVDGNLKLEEIQERMYGIQNLNIVKPFDGDGLFEGLKLVDLKDTKKFTNERVIKMKGHYNEQLQQLRGVLNDQKLRYEPKNGGGAFYWVPSQFLLN